MTDRSENCGHLFRHRRSGAHSPRHKHPHTSSAAGATGKGYTSREGGQGSSPAASSPCTPHQSWSLVGTVICPVLGKNQFCHQKYEISQGYESHHSDTSPHHENWVGAAEVEGNLYSNIDPLPKKQCPGHPSSFSTSPVQNPPWGLPTAKPTRNPTATGAPTLL